MLLLLLLATAMAQASYSSSPRDYAAFAGTWGLQSESFTIIETVDQTYFAGLGVQGPLKTVRDGGLRFEQGGCLFTLNLNADGTLHLMSSSSCASKKGGVYKRKAPDSPFVGAWTLGDKYHTSFTIYQSGDQAYFQGFGDLVRGPFKTVRAGSLRFEQDGCLFTLNLNADGTLHLMSSSRCASNKGGVYKRNPPFVGGWTRGDEYYSGFDISESGGQKYFNGFALKGVLKTASTNDLRFEHKGCLMTFHLNVDGTIYLVAPRSCTSDFAGPSASNFGGIYHQG